MLREDAIRRYAECNDRAAGIINVIEKWDEKETARNNAIKMGLTVSQAMNFVYKYKLKHKHTYNIQVAR